MRTDAEVDDGRRSEYRSKKAVRGNSDELSAREENERREKGEAEREGERKRRGYPIVLLLLRRFLTVNYYNSVGEHLSLTTFPAPRGTSGVIGQSGFTRVHTGLRPPSGQLCRNDAAATSGTA